MERSKEQEEKRETAIRECLREVETQLRGGMRYGTLTVVIQDGIPVGIDRTEKRRF